MSSLWSRVFNSVLLAILLALTAGLAIPLIVAGLRPPDTASRAFRELQSESDSPQQTDALTGTVDRFFQDSYGNVPSGRPEEAVAGAEYSPTRESAPWQRRDER
jgi:hypothetical protein